MGLHFDSTLGPANVRGGPCLPHYQGCILSQGKQATDPRQILIHCMFLYRL